MCCSVCSALIILYLKINVKAKTPSVWSGSPLSVSSPWTPYWLQEGRPASGLGCGNPAGRWSPWMKWLSYVGRGERRQLQSASWSLSQLQLWSRWAALRSSTAQQQQLLQPPCEASSTGWQPTGAEHKRLPPEPCGGGGGCSCTTTLHSEEEASLQWSKNTLKLLLSTVRE